MILRANKESSELGGHIASYQSAAMLYEIGFNHFWHAPSDGARRRPHLHPGPLLARDLRPRLPRGPDHRGAARGLPPGGLATRRPQLLPAPVADARLLAVPDRLDGARADHGDLPGAVHALPHRPRDRRHLRAARSGASSATARPTSPSRSARSRSPAASSSSNLVFVVNCNLQRLDGPVRGQRQDHPGARDDLPRRRLERAQGDLGRPLGSAAGGRPRRPARASAWRRPSTASTRSTRRATGRSCASTSSASTRSWPSGSRT